SDFDTSPASSFPECNRGNHIDTSPSIWLWATFGPREGATSYPTRHPLPTDRSLRHGLADRKGYTSRDPLSRGGAQRDAALLDSGAAAGAALVHRPGGVAHHNADPLERDVKFSGDDLGIATPDDLAEALDRFAQRRRRFIDLDRNGGGPGGIL